MSASRTGDWDPTPKVVPATSWSVLSKGMDEKREKKLPMLKRNESTTTLRNPHFSRSSSHKSSLSSARGSAGGREGEVAAAGREWGPGEGTLVLPGWDGLPGEVRPYSRYSQDTDSSTTVDSETSVLITQHKQEDERPRLVVPGMVWDTCMDTDIEAETGRGTGGYPKLDTTPPSALDIEDDEGFDTDMEFDEEDFLAGDADVDPKSDPDGVSRYLQECERLGVPPVSYLLKHIKDPHLRMKYHGLGPVDAKALAIPLERTTAMQIVDLKGNCIEGSGATSILTALKNNYNVSELNLSENLLESSGCRDLCEILSENTTIKALNIAGNKLRDSDAQHIHDLLVENITLKELNLAHNSIEIIGARWIRDALVRNVTLKVIDLSWNNIRLNGAEFMGNMIQENWGLTRVNLSMNGLSDVGARFIGHALLHNSSLEELDISNNRISRDGAIFMARGIIKNETLTTLKIGFNPIGLEGASALLMAFEKNPTSAMKLLDMSNVVVTDKFAKLQKKLSKEGREIEVIHGGVLYMPKQDKSAAADLWAAFHNDPMTKLKAYAKLAKLRLVDIFSQFDIDKSGSVNKDEFNKGIQYLIKEVKKVDKGTNVIVTEDDIDLLIEQLDEDGDGEVCYSELVEGDKVNRQNKNLVRRNIREREEAEAEQIALEKQHTQSLLGLT